LRSRHYNPRHRPQPQTLRCDPRRSRQGCPVPATTQTVAPSTPPCKDPAKAASSTAPKAPKADRARPFPFLLGFLPHLLSRRKRLPEKRPVHPDPHSNTVWLDGGTASEASAKFPPPSAFSSSILAINDRTGHLIHWFRETAACAPPPPVECGQAVRWTPPYQCRWKCGRARQQRRPSLAGGIFTGSNGRQHPRNWRAN